MQLFKIREREETYLGYNSRVPFYRHLNILWKVQNDTIPHAICEFR